MQLFIQQYNTGLQTWHTYWIKYRLARFNHFLRYIQKGLNMSLNTDLVAVLFFSNTNHVSLSTRIRFLDEALNVPEMVERFRTYRHPRIPVFLKWTSIV